LSRRPIKRIAAFASSVVASIAIRWLSAARDPPARPVPSEYLALPIDIDPSSRARDRRVVRRVLVQRDATERRSASESANRQAMPRAAPNALEIPDRSARKANRSQCGEFPHWSD